MRWNKVVENKQHLLITINNAGITSITRIYRHGCRLIIGCAEIFEMGEESNKGRLVCVTGGTGFLGSWMVKRLLQHGYSVNTTTRINPGLI